MLLVTFLHLIFDLIISNLTIKFKYDFHMAGPYQLNNYLAQQTERQKADFLMWERILDITEQRNVCFKSISVNISLISVNYSTSCFKGAGYTG